MKDDVNIEYDPFTGVVRTTPRQIFLEVTSRCNLNCVHCSKDFGRDEGHPKIDLPIEIIRGLRPWLERADSVNLNIVGESLMHPQFGEIIDMCTRGAAHVAFNTNGLLLSEDLCEHLVRARVASVVVSVDGMESNEPIRGVAYEAVRDRILLLDAVKKRHGAVLPHIGIAYTLMRRTLPELPRVLADILPRARIAAVHLQPLIVFYENMREENIYFVPGVDGALARCAAYAQAYGTGFTTFRSSFGNDERNREEATPLASLGQASTRFGCIDPFFEIKIRSDGSVMSCSYGLTPGLNVRTMSLDEIWNHTWYRDLRQRLFRREFTQDCQRCPYVFGSAENQTGHLRAGVEHSAAARLRAAPWPPREAAATAAVAEAGAAAGTPDAFGAPRVPRDSLFTRDADNTASP